MMSRMHIAKVGVSHLGPVFGEGMENNSAGNRVKKRGKTKFCIKNGTQVYYYDIWSPTLDLFIAVGLI